jgi:6,7-dimethyl-8-ribityllumazine synthase
MSAREQGDERMATYIEGDLRATGKKFGIIVSRFNSFVSERLLEGALDTLLRSGAEDGAIDVVRVPGAFEIPLMARKMAKSARRRIMTLSPMRRQKELPR